jgi:hypothetical protein
MLIARRPTNVSYHLAVLIAVLSELRTGGVVARWQVGRMQLPILAELRAPPHSADRGSDS